MRPGGGAAVPSKRVRYRWIGLRGGIACFRDKLVLSHPCTCVSLAPETSCGANHGTALAESDAVIPIALNKTVIGSLRHWRYMAWHRHK